MKNFLRQWWMGDAQWWEVWKPQSGPLGGLALGVILSLAVAAAVGAL